MFGFNSSQSNLPNIRRREAPKKSILRKEIEEKNQKIEREVKNQTMKKPNTNREIKSLLLSNTQKQSRNNVSCISCNSGAISNLISSNHKRINRRGTRTNRYNW